MLSNEAIKDFEQISRDFDIQSKNVRSKLESFDMKDKVEGIKQMIGLFQKCKNYQQ